MSRANNFSIIIPAYNEESLIATRLTQLADALPKNCTEIIIICNGCIDQTYTVAKNTIDTINNTVYHCNFMLVEISKGCKINALNEGVKQSNNNTIILLDADIDISSSNCADLVAILASKSLMAVSPKAIFDFKKSSWLIKKFYSVVSKSTYNQQHRIANVIALAPEAVKKLFPLPIIIADDAYIQRSITEKDYLVVNNLTYRFACPLTILSTIKVQSRIIRGNLQLKKTHPNLKGPKSTLPKLTFIDYGIFIFIKLIALTVAHIELKLNIQKWHQDESSRK